MLNPLTLIRSIDMGPGTWILIAVVAAAAAGGGGYAKGRHDGRKAEAAESGSGAALVEALSNNTEAMSKVAEAQLAPITIAAETQAVLAADGLMGCTDADKSTTPACLWDRCLRTGQSTADRAEGCSDLLDDVRIQSWVSLCGKTAEGKPDWKCVGEAIKAAREQD
jgi:hypothetical protein